MVRMWICLLLSLRLLGLGTAQAAEPELFLSDPSGINAMEVLQHPAMREGEESPRTGDHPAPLIGAMGIAFSVSALMVLTDQWKK